MPSDSDFFAQSFDVVGRDALCTKLDFHWECPGGAGDIAELSRARCVYKNKL